MSPHPSPAPQPDFVDRVNGRLAAFLDGQAGEVRGISPHAVELVASLRDLTRGGKRMRALFAHWGFRGAGGAADDDAAVVAGVALELFQAAALVHDDVIDRSATRRGMPAVHRRFAALHAERGWRRDGDRFGEAAAILAGDLALSYSERVFASIRPERPAARAVFDRMRTEVMAGQYLDVLEESAGFDHGDEGAVERARTVLRFKSAKYSVENPLLLGGALAGAGEDLLAGYSAFALPLGEAFQLRDDVLGVFGDPETTGKPAGDDLREGKRTELVAHALRLAGPGDRDFIAERLGADDLTDAEVARMRDVIREAGALDATEEAIAELSARGFAALEALPVAADVRSALRGLGTAAITRSS